MAFPPWLRLPSKDHLGLGRGWHFLFAWILAISLTSYLLYALVRGRVRTTLLPDRDQLDRRAVARDIWMHLRLKHHKGSEALRYNLLQKMSYLVVLFLLLPTMIATGMTMSNSAVAAFPWLIDLFQGRQTARTIHFVCAAALLSFVLIHLFQVVVAGFRREMRSMLTGWYEPAREEQP
jgi:thiosulfate reductase cytochrome b subunit